MSVARHGSGFAADVSALVSQVHPVFMLPPVAVSLFGSILAGEFSPTLAVVHAGAIFFAVYTAHVKDGYVDFYVRGEDDDHPLTAAGCRRALVGAMLGHWALAGVLFLVVDVWALVLTVPGWMIGYLHAPQLDTNPVTATATYPFGIALALLGGFYIQSGTLTTTPVLVAAVLLVLLSGVKIIDDSKDFEYDRSIQKETVAVVLGRETGRHVGYAFMGIGLVAVLALAQVDVLPLGAVFAVVAFGGVSAVASTKEPRLATMLLVRGAYLFLAALIVAVWYQPLSGPPAIDISVLGPYTYLATEVVFGTVAFALLIRAGVVERAAKTIAVLYPIAYVWDWYSLTVGIFAIPLKTGLYVLGLPLEEHLFIVVVPALVIGVHELLHDEAR